MSQFSSQFDRLLSAGLHLFGNQVVYTPQGGAPVPATAVMQPIRNPEGQGKGIYMLLSFKVADLPATPEKGDKVQVAGLTYTAVETELDTEGGATVLFRR